MFSETPHRHVAAFTLQFISPGRRDKILFCTNTSLSFAVMAIKKHSPAKESSWLWTGS